MKKFDAGLKKKHRWGMKISISPITEFKVDDFTSEPMTYLQAIKELKHDARDCATGDTMVYWALFLDGEKVESGCCGR